MGSTKDPNCRFEAFRSVALKGSSIPALGSRRSQQLMEWRTRRRTVISTRGTVGSAFSTTLRPNQLRFKTPKTLEIDEATLQGDRNRMGAIARPKFAKNALDVVLNRVFRNAQVRPYHLV
jgi:hypothetical protein